MNPFPRKWLATLTLPLASALTLFGCGGSKPATTVLPFDRVQAGPLRFESDPARPDQGIFHVATKVPMICAIVWGETTQFGHLNNSLDMRGTGISQHDVFLPGAQPGVTYRYVVEGTTAGGQLYRSQIGTFELQPVAQAAASAPLFGPNLALSAKVVAVSSEFSPAYAAANALDGNPNTEWATKGDGNNASMTIDLGAAKQVAAVEFITRSMADGTAITETYSVIVDGGRTLGPFPAGTLNNPRPSRVDVMARQLRFNVSSSTGGNVGAVEIRVLAPLAP